MAIKFNGGRGAIICDICRVIIKENLIDSDFKNQGVHVKSVDEYYHLCTKHEYLEHAPMCDVVTEIKNKLKEHHD